MEKRLLNFNISFVFLFFTATSIVYAQEPVVYGKNAFAFNLTRMAVSEINLSYERFLTSRRSIEFGGGLIYVNNYLKDQTKDWSDAELFSEHGYAGRFHYKIFKRPENSTKWRDYISPGIVFKNLYYNDRPIISETKPDYLTYDSILTSDTLIYTKDDTVYYNEKFLQKRKRIQIGIQFLWGKVYEASKTFAIEFYFGAGINITMATRTDHSRFATYRSKSYTLNDSSTIKDDNQRRNQTIPDFIDDFFYVRPSILVGIKLRLRM